MTKKVPKSTEKYSKLVISTLKYPKVPNSTEKYIKVIRDCRFFSWGGGTKVAKTTQNDQKVPKSTQNYIKILKITHKCPKVPISTNKYSKVHKRKGDHSFFFTGGTTKVAKNTENEKTSTQKYKKRGP